MSTGIKQIAKLANVSIGTVDRVLHKRAGVSKSTEKRVLKIIKETGYIRNTTASRLKLASIKKIYYAILIPVTKHKWNYWKLPKKGITKAVEELKELGVTADFYEFSDASSFIDQSKAIFKKAYDAIVTVPFFREASNDVLKKAKAKKIPVVFLDTEIALNEAAHFIRQNSHIAGMVAGRLLHGLVGNTGDYFVVNIINEKGIHANNIQRENGFKAYFKTINETVSIQTINYILNDEFKVTGEMENWFKSDNTKGIFVTNSKSHLLPKILQQYNVGKTFMVGFDLNKRNLKFLKNDEIDFLINQQPEYQGYAAIKGLFQFLTKGDTSALTVNIPVEIIVKENSGMF
ncbi:MAG: substrate-binding domain-containing protein [Maribacter sp.]|nr:substrate-binding domain-containing protein [Maribacter sp.]